MCTGLFDCYTTWLDTLRSSPGRRTRSATRVTTPRRRTRHDANSYTTHGLSQHFASVQRSPYGVIRGHTPSNATELSGDTTRPRLTAAASRFRDIFFRRCWALWHWRPVLCLACACLCASFTRAFTFIALRAGSRAGAAVRERCVYGTAPQSRNEAAAASTRATQFYALPPYFALALLLRFSRKNKNIHKSRGV